MICKYHVLIGWFYDNGEKFFISLLICGGFLVVHTGLLFVSRIEGRKLSSADAPAASRGTSLPLVGTQWYLREMGGKTREMLGADSAAFTLVLSDSANLVAGSGAGNRFFGEYRCDLNMLSIRVQGRTQMFCPRLDSEDRYLRMLDSVKSYCIHADTLRLYDCHDREFAVFIGR